MKKFIIACIPLLMGMVLCSSCLYKLSFKGATIPPGMKTMTVSYFENNAPLVVNYLSQNFTEALKNRIRSTTSISIIQDENLANATMSGNIVDYNYAPISVQATNNNAPPIAGATRLTISVKVVYVNKLEKNYSFNQTFTAYKDFTGDIAAQEQALTAAIIKQLTEDIFNKAFNNW